MRISSNNAICLVVGVLVLSVQCLFFTKSLYTRDIRILQSKVTLLTREASLLRDRRLSQQKKMSNADKVLLSRLRAVLKNYKVAKQLNVMNDNVAPPTSKKGNTVIRKITETTAAETRSKKIQSSPQAITSEINTTMSWSRSTAKSTTALQITTKNRSKIVTTKAMPISSGISLKIKSTPGAFENSVLSNFDLQIKKEKHMLTQARLCIVLQPSTTHCPHKALPITIITTIDPQKKIHLKHLPTFHAQLCIIVWSKA